MANRITWILLVVGAVLGAACGDASVVATNPSTTTTIAASSTTTTTLASTSTTEAAALRCEPLPSDVEEIDTAPHWEDGETVEYELIQYHRTEEGHSTTPVRVTVLEAGPDGYLLSWDLGKTTFDLPALGGSLSGDALGAIGQITNIDLEYEVNAWGEYLGLQNIDEVRDRMVEAFQIMGELRGEPVPEDALAALLEPEALENITTKDVQRLHQHYGWVLSPGERLEYESALANPITGDPVAADATVELVDAHGADGCVAMRTSTVMDAEAFLESVTAIIDELGGEPLDPEEVTQEFYVEIATEVRWDPGSTWIDYFAREEIVSAGPESGTERLEIIRVGP